MAKITILTRMHNPGKYVYRCVDSVLNQTYTDFKFVIVDNASSDGTKEILEEYARKDDRILLLRNELNNVLMFDCILTLVDTEYFMVLDHDDWLEERALENLLLYAEENQLDMAFGRTNFRNADEELLETRGCSPSVILSSDELPDVFPVIYWQLRTTWATLIKSSMISHIDQETFEIRKPSKYAGDTVMMLSMVFASDKVGFLNKVVHNYRVHESSESYNFCRDRFLADWVIFDMAKTLLKERNGYSKQNEEFLYKVYAYAICDTARVALKSNQNVGIVTSVLMEIIEHPHTQEMISILASDSEERKCFIDTYAEGVRLLAIYAADSKVKDFISNWLKLLYGNLGLTRYECERLIYSRNIRLDVFGGNENAIYEKMFTDEVVYKEQSVNVKLAFLLRCEKNVQQLASRLLLLSSEFHNLYEKIPVYIEFLAKQNGLLEGIEKEDHRGMMKVILMVVANDYRNALSVCLEIIQDETKKIIDVRKPLQLAINLSAILEDSTTFIRLKKLECGMFLELGEFRLAEEVLVDLEDMCLQDEEVRELRTYLRNAKKISCEG